jgi:aspartate racemase
VEVVGLHDHPRITLDSIPLAAWMPAFDAADLGGVAKIMLESTRLLAEAGADFAICPDNSAHLAWPHLRDISPIPWLHIVEVVGAEARARGVRRVGVLGTRFTMGGTLYPDVLSPMGIETIVPEAGDMALVDAIIFDELVNGEFTDASRAAYVEVIERLADRGCDAVALACTEIPLLVGPGDSPLPVLDSTRLLASAALQHAIS